jgi:signal transduction histidine kinase
MLVAEVMSTVTRKYKVPRIRVETMVDNEIGFCTGKRRMLIILENLLSNAFQYIKKDEPAPLVKVEIKVTPGFVNIDVIDNGIGIDFQHQEKIFEMFYRASNQGMGAGLGLYITRKIVNTLQGEIHVSSAPGKGSVFSVTLPDLSEILEKI